MKTEELIGGRLNFWVAKAEGRAVDYHDLGAHCGDFVTVVDTEQSGWVSWSPSRVWADAGPLIERERIGVIPFGPDGLWLGSMPGDVDYCAGSDGADGQLGPTPLIAAMRAFVASKFGAQVVDGR